MNFFSPLKENKTNFWLSTIVGSLIAILISQYITPATSYSFQYITLLLIITLATLSGGFLSGVIITGFALLTKIQPLFSNKYPIEDVLILWAETGFFAITAFLISYFLDKYKKTDVVAHYKTGAKKHLDRIKVLEEEKRKMLEEIRLRDEFLSIASHELKTPLTSMLVRIQSLLHSIRNVSLANFSVQNLLNMLETAEEQTKKLSQMINDLLNVSLITTGKYTLEPKKEDISLIVKDVAHEFSEKLKKDNYSLTVLADKPAEAVVDKLRVSQVITNLLTNAMKYGNGKPIEVAVKRKNGIAAISVKDNGIGIDKDQYEKIFNLFERGRVKNNIKGLGVGLYISNQIVKAHGGKIKVNSRINKGSTFTVELPAKTP